MIKSANGKTLLQAPKLHGLYLLDNELAKNQAYQSLMAFDVQKKLGNIYYKALRHLLNHAMIHGIKLDSIGDKITCNSCIKLKITSKPLLKDSGERAKKLGEKLYSNVWGPSRHLRSDKKSYYVSFIDDYSRESVIYLMSSKDQVFSKHKLYEAMMCRKWKVYIKILVSDQGGKYSSKEFEDYLSRKGIKH